MGMLALVWLGGASPECHSNPLRAGQRWSPTDTGFLALANLAVLLHLPKTVACDDKRVKHILFKGEVCPVHCFSLRMCLRRIREYVEIAAAIKSLQSCPTLCDPMDGSPPGSSIPGILQARTLGWVAISFSNA